MSSGSTPQVIARLNEFRSELNAGEISQFGEMTRRWRDVERGMTDKLQLLLDDIAARQARGETVSQSKLFQMERYQALLAQTHTEYKSYSRWAAEMIERKQGDLAAFGIRSATDLIRAQYMDAGMVGARFDILPVEAINAGIGFAADGTPLKKLLTDRYPDAAAGMTRQIIDSLAQGINPRETARYLNALGAGLQHSLVVARTEQIRAYRQATSEQYKASGVVKSYRRNAAKQERTCLACLALDGKIQATEDLFENHPCCRCFITPVIDGLPPVEVESGAAWFARQDDATQKSMMGEERFAAWKDGQFGFGDLAKVHEHEVWGPTVGITPLSELVAGK